MVRRNNQRSFWTTCCPCLKPSARLDKEIFILMLGLDNAGKTCTAKTMVGEPLLNITPTIGFSKAQTLYKGYNITIYDLGGSKSFRGIWPKYYHEVHGFIFVVDSSDEHRLKECAQELKSFLIHDKVQGKPLLILCNKSDEKNAMDELHIVEALNIEQLVNEAACPTRMEPAVATKGVGLRDGYKWLIKSIILDIHRLGPRVEEDKNIEKEKETIRLEEIRKRIKERQEAEANEGDDHEVSPPGFVPIKEILKQTTNGNTIINLQQSSPTKRQRLKQLFCNKIGPLLPNEHCSSKSTSKF